MDSRVPATGYSPDGYHRFTPEGQATIDGVLGGSSFQAVPLDGSNNPVARTVLTGGSAPAIVLIALNADNSDQAAARFATNGQDVFPCIVGEMTPIPFGATITRVDIVGIAATAATGTGVIVDDDSEADAKTALENVGPLSFDAGDEIQNLLVTVSPVYNTNDVMVFVEGYSR